MYLCWHFWAMYRTLRSRGDLSHKWSISNPDTVPRVQSLREPKKPGVATPGVMSSSATKKTQSNQISGQSDSFLLAPNGESSAGSETWRANVRCASTTSRVSLLVSGR